MTYLATPPPADASDVDLGLQPYLASLDSSLACSALYIIVHSMESESRTITVESMTMALFIAMCCDTKNSQ
ncbi:unnamed protein product [Penicillium nalgiovense]|nr:unnamed protein product [Penicillium nalgiovense]